MAAKKEPEEAPAENASHEEDAAAVAAKQDDLDFVKYTFDTRKTAYKEGDAVTISSVTKARVRIVGFTSGRAMQGRGSKPVFPCSLSRNITPHSMKNLAFHSFLRWKRIILSIIVTSLEHFL